MFGLLLLPVLSAAVCVIALTLLLRNKARLPLDHPNERSLHGLPMPRIGGLGIMMGLLVCVPFYVSDVLLVPLLVALVLFGLSFFDDIGGLSVRARLIAQIVATVVTLYFLPGLPGWTLLLALFAVVWMTNLFNFMDGSDGLAGGMALFGFFTYGVAAWLGGAESFALLAWVIAAAAAAFLLFNFPPARLFMGDAGSIPLGYLAAALGLVGWVGDLWPLMFPLLVFSPFIFDASLTLLRRLLVGEAVWQAHRNHYYQRLVRMGWSHRQLALTEYCVMASAGFSSLILLLYPDWSARILLLWGAFYVACAIAIDRRYKELGFAY